MDNNFCENYNGESECTNPVCAWENGQCNPIGSINSRRNLDAITLNVPPSPHWIQHSPLPSNYPRLKSKKDATLLEESSFRPFWDYEVDSRRRLSGKIIFVMIVVTMKSRVCKKLIGTKWVLVKCSLPKYR